MPLFLDKFTISSEFFAFFSYEMFLLWLYKFLYFLLYKNTFTPFKLYILSLPFKINAYNPYIVEPSFSPRLIIVSLVFLFSPYTLEFIFPKNLKNFLCHLSYLFHIFFHSINSLVASLNHLSFNMILIYKEFLWLLTNSLFFIIYLFRFSCFRMLVLLILFIRKKYFYLVKAFICCLH